MEATATVFVPKMINTVRSCSNECAVRMKVDDIYGMYCSIWLDSVAFEGKVSITARGIKRPG